MREIRAATASADVVSGWGGRAEGRGGLKVEKQRILFSFVPFRCLGGQAEEVNESVECPTAREVTSRFTNG